MAPYMADGDMVIPDDGGYFPDKLVEIGNTVAIADSIAPGPVNAPRAEWQDYSPVDAEDDGDIEDIPCAH